MAVIIGIHDAGLTRRKYSANKWLFISFVISKEDLRGDRVVDVNTNMRLSFLAATRNMAMQVGMMQWKWLTSQISAWRACSYWALSRD
jgi:hypothetical protein